MVNITRKLLICMAVSALAAGAAHATINAWALPTVPYDGAMTPVYADKTDGDFDGVPRLYFCSGSTFNNASAQEQEMKLTANGRYVGYLPAVGVASTYSWKVADNSDSTSAQPTTIGSTIDYSRFHDGVAYNASTAPYGWNQHFESNFWAETPKYAQSGLTADLWIANGVGNGSTAVFTGQRGLGGAIDTTIGMQYPVSAFQNLPPSAMPYIRSPKLDGGVGTIDFRSILVTTSVNGSPSRNIRTSELTLQIAYTDDEPEETNWVDVVVYKYGTANGNVFSRINHEVLNDPKVTYVRIFRSGFNEDNPEASTSGRLAIDNICITKPTADLGISHKLENPGYPSAQSNVLIRCSVTNVIEATQATNRQVTCFYQYVPTSDTSPDPSKWLSTPMTNYTDNTDWYQGTIGGTNTGYVWYYYEVKFDGYCYGLETETDQTGVRYGNRELPSPSYWDNATGGEATIREPPSVNFGRYQVRPYASRYARVSFDATDGSLSQGAMTLVADDTWQCVVPVTGQTVISNFFSGHGFYEDDADEYRPLPIIWGENNPPATLTDPTLAGNLESSLRTSVTHRLVALNEKVYKGFYLYRFSSNDDDLAAATDPDGDKRHDYIVKKAVYQDFDDWTASQEYYETSLGGLPTTTYAEDFDGNSDEAKAGSVVSTSAWNVATFDYKPADTKYETFQDVEPSDKPLKGLARKTVNAFYVTDARALEDRKGGNGTAVNRSLSLQVGGQVENLGSPSTNTASITYGLEKIEFRARASVDDDNFAIYKNGTTWTLASAGNDNGPYIYISTKWYFAEMSPSKPYFSYILFYKPAASYLAEEEPATWYELRIIKDDCNTADDNTATFQLWHRDSTGKNDILLGEQKATGASNNDRYKFKSNNPKDINIRLNNNNNRLYVKINVDGNNPDSANVTLTHNKKTYTDTSLASVGGTIGFGVFDAVPVISKVTVGNSFGGTNFGQGNPGISSISEADWSHGGRGSNNAYRWTFPIEGGVTKITRAVTTQRIDIYVGDVVGDEERVLIEKMPETATTNCYVNSLSLTNVFSFTFHDWARKFVVLKNDEEGDGGVVIDDIYLRPWRARSFYEGGDAELSDGTRKVKYLAWETESQQNEWLNETTLDGETRESMRDHWGVLEGWLVNGTFGRGVRFERSRANTNLVQGVVSPEMTNGMGSVSFRYDVTGGRVVYGVETTVDGNYNEWRPVAIYTNYAGQSGQRYVKIAKSFGGRVRVRVYGEDTDNEAAILIDTLRTKDYPENDGNAWIAYNLRITDSEELRNAGLIYTYSGKSCFLNNSATDGTYGTEEYPDDDPYLQTPPLYGVGVGEIAFQYRLVATNANELTDGEIVIKAAADYNETNLVNWVTITNLTLSADGLEGRGGTAFVKFDNPEIFDEDHFVVRFYNTRDPSKSRVVIDNVLVTAPARASFEFEYVRLSPLQPVVGSNTTVEAKIMRPILNPQNINIYCSYHTWRQGEPWGYRNWFVADTNAANCVKLEPVGGNVYRTSEGIPGTNAVDSIIEYVVWGIHDAIKLHAGDTPIWQGFDTFQTPEWYKTFDEDNEEVVALPLPGNIVNPPADEATGSTWSPYYWVYSCAPGAFFINEIKNWRTTSDRGVEFIEFAGPADTDVGGWRMVLYNTQSGYGDFDHTIPAGKKLVTAKTTMKNGWAFYMWADECAEFPIDEAFPDSSDVDDGHLGTYGGILLYRSNGAIEHMICYGTQSRVDPENGGVWRFFTYAGRKASGDNSLSLVSNADEAGLLLSDFTWAGREETPAAMNLDQIVVELPYDGPATQSYYAPSGVEITNENVIAWINNCNNGVGASQEDIDALLTDEKLNTLYLLNQDLTKECDHTLSITGVSVDGNLMRASATLVRTENGQPVGTRAINGRLVLEGSDTLSGSFYRLDPVNREITITDVPNGQNNDDFSHSNDVDIHFLRLRIVE